MTTPRLSLPLLCLLLMPCLAGAVAADVVLVAETRNSDASSASRVASRLWLDADRIRMEFEDPGKPDTTAIVIFRGDQHLFWTLDSRARSYVQLDREEMQKLGARVRQAEKEMRARLPDLPASQRAQVEVMLERMAPQAIPPREEIVATDRRQEINGVSCKIHELQIEGAVVGEVCTVEWSDTEINRESLAVFELLAAFQREMMSTLGATMHSSFGGQPFDLFYRLPGFPLMIRRLVDGQSAAETRLGLPKTVAPMANRYDLPVDFERRSGPGDGGS